MKYKLGKRPARFNAVKFKFSTFFTAAKLPTPPTEFGHYKLMKDPWDILGNDEFGDCVWAGAAHEQMLWSLEGGTPRQHFATHNVLSDYAAATGFDPTKPDTDQGSDVQAAAAYRQKVGIVDMQGVRHKIKAYVAITPGNLSQLALATWLFGAVGIGVNLPAVADQQFDAGMPWDVDLSSNTIGGHYVPCVGRDADGNFVVITWGKLQRVTPTFLHTYMDEAVAYLSQDILNKSTHLSPENFNEALLDQYLSEVAA